MVPWRSGYALDCKSSHPGSIPGGTSKSSFFPIGSPVKPDEKHVLKDMRPKGRIFRFS